MNASHIFLPVLAQVFLTLIMFFVLGARRFKAAKAGTVNRRQALLDKQAWPDDVIKVSNNITNQFETPVLFYVLCLVIYNANLAGMAAIALAWLYVASRYAHAYVHAGSNYVPARLGLFLFGCLVLLAMFVLVTWKLTVGVF